MLLRPKAAGTKRDSSAAQFSLQETNLSKQQKDDKDDHFPFLFDKVFGMDVDSFLDLDSAEQTLKLKSLFAKLEEEAVGVKSEKSLMTKKIEKLEKAIENRATLQSELNLAKKDLLTAKLSLADKDIRLFELQSSVKSARTPSLITPHPASNPPTSNPSARKNTRLYAEVPKKPVLIAHVGGTQTAPFRLLAVFSPTYWDRAYRFKDEVLRDEIRRKQGNVSAFSGFMLGQCRFLIRCFWVYLRFFKINQIFV
jgi:hypothetical protein